MRSFLAGCLVAMVGCSAPSTSPQPVIDEPNPVSTTVQTVETPVQKEASPPFRLPGDDSGKMLAKVLPPSARPGALRNPTRPTRPAVAPPPLTELPPTPSTPALVRLPVPPRRDRLRPEFLLDERLDGVILPANVPREPSFVIDRLIRVEGDPVAIPPPLSPLTLLVPDRVSIEDATTGASLSAVLAAPLPRRMTPVPYTRQSVPEPFEHRQPWTLSVPDEPTTPQTGTARPAKK